MCEEAEQAALSCTLHNLPHLPFDRQSTNEEGQLARLYSLSAGSSEIEWVEGDRLRLLRLPGAPLGLSEMATVC